MKQVQPDVWETETQSPFPGLNTHAYLLTRDDGNVLFYNTGHLHEVENLAQHGGVARQYLSHEDELGDTLNTIAERYGSLLVGHREEEASFAKVRTPDIFIERREIHMGNIEVIPTPGHSAGSTCFLVRSPTGKTYLFTGDTLYLDKHNRWTAGFIKSVHTEGDRPVLAESLRLLATLKPDVVFGSAFVGEHGFEDVSDGSWPEKVDQALGRLLKDAPKQAREVNS
ncbi:MBL fold metallo-hydrolase [Marinimicrobium sp. ABcell2]|uniref:MBL fold metallo-hydrolase n=1 Tax=Marinimicrobium sp. ABcell2 TaxID=3069751 RepID=UPI0027B3D83C|nr:MBL fold metallo-hydrolase [Marinimicrobium sp. ABcell2]MDQ2077123.1 MBL fold metallo-hydrolase [Marinimicrobium sp. ABcell2]